MTGSISTIDTSGNIVTDGTIKLDNTTLENRKINLYETANNDHQFYGFGVNASTLRYQVDSSASSHVFYCGGSPTTSAELFRINGTGICVTPVSGGIQFSNSLSGYLPTRIQLYEEFAYTSNFTGAFTLTAYSFIAIRQNDTVFLRMGRWSGTTTVAGVMTSSTALPTRFRPASEVRAIVSGIRNTQRSISVRVATTGIITFFGDDVGGNFTSANPAGFDGQAIFYSAV